MVPPSNGISIDPAVLAGHIRVINKQTHRQTERPP